MSDYLSRSEIDRVLFDSLDDDCEDEQNVCDNSENEDAEFDIDGIVEDDDFLTIDDVFHDSDSDGEVEGPKIKYTAKSGNEIREYLAYPPPKTRRTVANIVRQKPGLKPSGKVSTLTESFCKFFTGDALSIIVTHSNEEAVLKNYEPTDETEMLAFIGILLAMGANNDTKLSISDLWSLHHGRSAYIAGMSRNRFKEILSIIRFDDKQTREERRKEDKFAPVRELYDVFNETLITHYIPSPNVVIDEMLSLFRGRCPFKVFLKEKPGKYGILIRILADCESRMVLNSEVYSGKTDGRSNTTVEVVKRLIKPIDKTGRNVTTDRFYTSVPLAEDLYKKHSLTMVGTLQSNRKFIPNELKTTEGRPLYSSMFAFTEPKSDHAPVTLQSYIAKEKPKRNLLLLSTQHNDDAVDQDNNEKFKSKSNINLFYNSTKGGVDTIDQMARKYSVKRSTNRWPLTVFFTMIDIAGINAFTIFTLNYPAWNDKKTNRRRIFLQELAIDLIRPQAERRALNISGLHNNVVMAIENVVGRKVKRPRASSPQSQGKGRCYACCAESSGESRRKLSKTANRCCKCNKCVCGKHSDKVYCCITCKNQYEDSE